MNGDGALLTYMASTVPAPLQVSPRSGDPSLGTVRLVVSNDGDVPILCTAIELTFPLGDLAQEASSDFSGVTLNVRSGNWAFESPVADGVFTARPKAPADAEITKDGLELEVGGLRINQQVGTFELQITETSSLQGGSPQPRDLSLPIPKFPYQFTVSDFQASAYDVEPGGSVTLLWQGSVEGTYTVSYEDGSSKQLVGGTSWPSPALYAPANFMLTAQATDGEQTVTTELGPVHVDVDLPSVVEFYAAAQPGGNPIEQIDPGATVYLVYRTENATGATFIAGGTAQGEPPPTLQPAYGVTYELEAYTTAADGTLYTSPASVLPIAFNPLQIVGFTADRTQVDGDHPAVTLSWQVEHAQSVTLQGTPVPQSGTAVEHPTADTAYELVATWVDGTQHSPPPITVTAFTVTGFTLGPPRFVPVGDSVFLTLALTGTDLEPALVNPTFLYGSNGVVTNTVPGDGQFTRQEGDAAWSLSTVVGQEFDTPDAAFAFTLTFNGVTPLNTTAYQLVLWGQPLTPPA